MSTALMCSVRPINSASRMLFRSCLTTCRRSVFHGTLLPIAVPPPPFAEIMLPFMLMPPNMPWLLASE